MASAQCDIRRSPIDASVSWRVMDPEYYTIGALPQLPGLYGFRVQDRVQPNTMTIVYNTTGGASFVRVTAAPVTAGQFFLDETSGLVICNALDVGSSVVVNYNGGGTIFSIDQITAIATAAGSAVQLPSNHLTGFTLSNSVGDPTNDIDFAVGLAKDSTNTKTITGAAMTKRLDAAWSAGTNQGGLDTGSIGNAVYHCFAIQTAGGTQDYLFSLSPSSPTLPGGYVYFRRIGSIIRSAGSILAFSQDGDEFLLAAQTHDESITNIGTSAISVTMTVPTGIIVKAIAYVAGFSGAGSSIYGMITSLDQNDETPNSTHCNFGINLSGSFGAEYRIRTNTSGQIRVRFSGIGSDSTLDVYGAGWIDSRGK